MAPLVYILGSMGFAYDGKTLFVRVLIPGGGTPFQRRMFKQRMLAQASA